ncbi:peptide ligase PGM1-related protein [Streptomyces cremeus]|uniref:Peptide ligase PGM1-related protein n=1 Tax=Streptomyces cremeus TaxID=66881 RepID=A0ABV5PJI5_STRCM
MNDVHAKPRVVFANFLSDLAVDLGESEALAHWAQQAPRKIWTLRPGDVLVTPLPLSEAFMTYACALLRMPPASVTVLDVPPAGAVPLAQAVREAELTERVRALAAAPGTVLLPTALDASAIGFAREIGVTVHPFPTVDAAGAALEVTMLLNTKAGFRDVAGQLGMRLPAGDVCRRAETPATVSGLLEKYPRVVVKPDRSAGGHGLRFVGREDRRWADEPLAAVGGAEGLWVVEECLDVAASVSIQLENTAEGTRAVFHGAMRTVQGSFTGYLSPLPPQWAHLADELEEWGTKLGGHLAQYGYAGPFSLDALVTEDGRLYASESNIRRTATTTPYAMVTRLTAASGPAHPTWALGKGRARHRFGLPEALERLAAHRLAFDPAHGAGVVLYADEPADGHSWRYAVIAPHAARLTELEDRLPGALGFVSV